MLSFLNHASSHRCFMSTTSSIVLIAVVAALGTPPPEPFYIDVRTYLPESFVTDGSVDYREHIQRCFDENAQVFFPGSDDPDRPMIYGATFPLETGPMRRIRFGPNAVLKRLPRMGNLLVLGRGTHLTGAVIDGNKYAHWPLMKDREVKAYAYATGAAVMLKGRNLLRDCFVYHNAGIAFGGWGGSDNRIYRCRVEGCGFLEALGDLSYWGSERASADGFYFGSSSRYNIVKDSEAIDCSRWGGVVTEGASYTTFVDVRGGNLHFSCYGFIDIEGAGPGNDLVRCRSPNSQIVIQQKFQDVVGCRASLFVADHTSYPRLIGCDTVGGPVRVSRVLEDRFVTPGRESPMLAGNRVILSGPDAHHSLTVICSDRLGTVAWNHVYGFDDGERRSTEMLLFGVGHREGNRQSWGDREAVLDGHAPPRYLRAWLDMAFKEKFDGTATE